MQFYARQEQFAHGTLQFGLRRMKKAVIFVSLLSFLGVASAQTQPKSASKPDQPAKTQFMSVDEVHAGMKGIAYTVFQGTQPESMGVEVLGVLKNMNGPKSDVVLVRLTGAKAEYTGVVA